MVIDKIKKRGNKKIRQPENKGDIPTFVLPSVWYSTLLKYKNRTENDYGAFCKFLSMLGLILKYLRH